jgi:hypothetical protein
VAVAAVLQGQQLPLPVLLQPGVFVLLLPQRRCGCEQRGERRIPLRLLLQPLDLRDELLPLVLMPPSVFHTHMRRISTPRTNNENQNSSVFNLKISSNGDDLWILRF